MTGASGTAICEIYVGLYWCNAEIITCDWKCVSTNKIKTGHVITALILYVITLGKIFVHIPYIGSSCAPTLTYARTREPYKNLI